MAPMFSPLELAIFGILAILRFILLVVITVVIPIKLVAHGSRQLNIAVNSLIIIACLGRLYYSSDILSILLVMPAIWSIFKKNNQNL
jgi:hypothetical protein